MFEIFTDSASNLTKRLINKHRIRVVPFTCVIDGEEYRCDGDKSQFDYDMFYKALREKEKRRHVNGEYRGVFRGIRADCEIGQKHYVYWAVERIVGHV